MAKIVRLREEVKQLWQFQEMSTRLNFECNSVIKQLDQERERSKKLVETIQFALIYNPDIDRYKIKHTVYPKLKKALVEFERGGA